MNRNYAIYIQDIIAAIESIFIFIKDMTLEEFKNDEKTISAVIWKFEVMGEASKKIPLEIILNNENIPWKEMARMRDRLIHGYQTIKPEILWITIQEK